MQRILTLLSAMTLSLILAGPVSAETASGPVTCTDGTTAPHGGKGACAHHGGIKKAEAKTAETPAAEKPAKETKKTKKKSDKTKPESAAQPATPATPATPAEPAAAPARPSAGKSSPGNTNPAGATARCKDGTYSHAKTHQGACSRHGGVAEWLDGSGNK